jgi:hypothetical protein
MNILANSEICSRTLIEKTAIYDGQWYKAAPTIDFYQLLHKTLGFFLNMLLNVPPSRLQIPQGHEKEISHLFSLLSITKYDS